MTNISKLYIISGPSGAGQDSVITGLRNIFPIEKVVTTTTREIRPGESAGKDYYFVSKDRFRQMIEDQAFFEWTEEDNKQLYGGTLSEIERVKNSGQIGIWKIDYKGVIAAKKLFPEAISIHISIPKNLIEKRLRARGNHSEDFIRQRLEYAEGWYQNRDIFDYEVENIEGELAQTIDRVAEIIKKEANIE